MRIVTSLLLTLLLGVNSYCKTSDNLEINLSVTESGFQPNKVDVTPNTPVILKITRITDNTCATSIQIPSLKIKKDLPLNKAVKIKIGKLQKGEIRFGCGMEMMEGGKIFVK